MADLLAQLKAGAQAVAKVKLGDIELGLRLLTEQDYMEAQLAVDTEMKLKKLTLDVATADIFEDEKTSQLLLRALVDPTTSQPIAPSAKALREALTRAQRVVLIEAYLAHEKQYSPSERTVTDAEFNALLETVKKTPEMTALNDLSLETLKKLILSLASQQSN